MPPLRPLARSVGLVAFALTACDSDPAPEDVFAEAEANVGEWTWIDVEGSTCRDGSDTGFGIRLQEGANDLMIYLEGGGACFNASTCRTNPSTYGEDEFNARIPTRGNAGILDASDAANPVADWNAVYVPYCTGDIHGGTDAAATVPGVSTTQRFVGHRNVERVLDLVAPYVGTPDRLLLVGVSAGGFGTLVNFVEVADRFDGATLILLNDSGPILFADDVFSPSIGTTIADLYSLPGAFPPDASALFQPDGLQGIYTYLAERYPDARFGLASYLQDQTIRDFFAFGQPDAIMGYEYAAALRDLRANLPDAWATYYAPGEAHVFTDYPDRYTGVVGGVALNDWLQMLLEGSARNVAP